VVDGSHSPSTAADLCESLLATGEERDDFVDDVAANHDDDLQGRACLKDADRPSAARLAKRLYYLDGFRKSDVSPHLSKKSVKLTPVAFFSSSNSSFIR